MLKPVRNTDSTLYKRVNKPSTTTTKGKKMRKYYNSLWVFTSPDELLEFINEWKQGNTEDLPGDPLELPLDFQMDDLEMALQGRADVLPVVLVECWHGSEITVTPMSLEVWDTFEEDGDFAACMLDKMFFVGKETQNV